jgi:hypothetical protein
MMVPNARNEAEKLVAILRDQVLFAIKTQSERILNMDRRPMETWSESKPDVFFRYVAQNILEVLIQDLQEQV